MDIPTNDDGMFEIITSDDEVVGHGVIHDDGHIDLVYGDDHNATFETIAKFQAEWVALGYSATLSFRAAA